MLANLVSRSNAANWKSREKWPKREAMYSERMPGMDAKMQEGRNQDTRATCSCKLTSPIGLQSQAIGEPVSSLVVDSHRAKRSEPRRAGARSGVAAQICRVAGIAFFGIRCFVDGAAVPRMAEDTVVSTHCGPVGMASCAVGGRTSARSELVDAKL